MTTQDLHPLLDPLADTREVVVRRLDDGDGLLAVWRAAAEDARGAYARWCGTPGRAARTAYQAAEDRADAALASLRSEAGALLGV